jgi:hypothetical protein
MGPVIRKAMAKKPYTLAGFKPGIFCSVGGHNGQYARPQGQQQGSPSGPFGTHDQTKGTSFY